MAFAKTIRQFSLLVLDENESYLSDRADGLVRILKPNQPSRLIKWINDGGAIDSDELVELIKASLVPPVEKTLDLAVRLCSKSIILDQSQTGKNIFKIPFNKTRGVWFLPPDPPSRRPSTANLLTPASQTSRSPRIVLLSDTMISVSCSSVGGRYRTVRPYATHPGPWLIEIRLSSLSTVPNPEPTWCHKPVEFLVQQKKLLNSSDPLFFLLMSSKIIQLFLCNVGLQNSTSLSPSTIHSIPTDSIPNSAFKISYDSAVQFIQSLVPCPDSFPFARLDHRESQLLSLPVERQLPLHTCRGILAITDAAIYFRPFPNLDKGPFLRVPWIDLRAVILRIVDLQPTALALLHSVKSTTSTTAPFTISSTAPTTWRTDLNIGSSEVGELNFICGSHCERNKVVEIISNIKPNVFISGRNDSNNFLKHMTDLWRTRRLDTFHYLGFLNSISGRSSEDLSQYPIMPWTYIDFQSKNIDLDDAKRYRNLKLPIGAINDDCLKLLRERLEEVMSIATDKNEELNRNPTSDVHNLYDLNRCINSSIPRFLYGSHYSTAAYVVYWLIRLIPECQLRLQSGKFDAWPRLFHSIQQTWNGLKEGRATSFMELIPEFYDHSNYEFLENRLGLNVCSSSEVCVRLGFPCFIEVSVNPNSGILSDVELPSWCDNNPSIFLKVLREGLESDIVSDELNNWIDLIFGYQQNGENAEAALNLFHPITYLTTKLGTIENQSSLKKIKADLASNRLENSALLTQIREFGQAPIQLFAKPHPKRLTKEEVKRLYGRGDGGPPPTDLRSIISYSRSCLPWYIHLETDQTLTMMGNDTRKDVDKDFDDERYMDLDIRARNEKEKAVNDRRATDKREVNDIRNRHAEDARPSIGLHPSFTETFQHENTTSNGTLSGTAKRNSGMVGQIQAKVPFIVTNFKKDRNEQEHRIQGNDGQLNLARFRTSRVIKAKLTFSKELLKASIAPCYATTIESNKLGDSLLIGTSYGTICQTQLLNYDETPDSDNGDYSSSLPNLYNNRPFCVCSSPITALCCNEKFTIAGSQNGSLSIIRQINDKQITESSHDDNIEDGFNEVIPISNERIPHTDTITTVAADHISNDISSVVCTGSIDHVVSFWHPISTGLQLGGVSEIYDISASSITQNIALLGSRHGEVTLWDLRVSEDYPIWEGSICLDHYGRPYQHRPVITHCDTSALLSSGCFTITAVVDQSSNLLHDPEVPAKTSNSTPSFGSSYTRWDVEKRGVFNGDVYDSFRVPYCFPLQHYHQQSLHPATNFQDSWTALLLDVRMIGPSASSCSLSTQKVNLDAGIVGRYCWESSGPSRKQGNQQRITTALTDGHRWAIAIGAMTTTVSLQREGATEASSSESLMLSSDVLRSPQNYTFCSVADLSQGLRANEVCRWPLVLGTDEELQKIYAVMNDENISNLTTPRLIVPSKQWNLTGESNNPRLCIANMIGQIELIS